MQWLLSNSQFGIRAEELWLLGAGLWSINQLLWLPSLEVEVMKFFRRVIVEVSRWCLGRTTLLGPVPPYVQYSWYHRNKQTKYLLERCHHSKRNCERRKSTTKNSSSMSDLRRFTRKFPLNSWHFLLSWKIHYCQCLFSSDIYFLCAWRKDCFRCFHV